MTNLSALIGKWMGRGRLMYAVTPRFAVTSTPEQLEAAGALCREFPDVYMQTHIAENVDEVDLVMKTVSRPQKLHGRL
jgi:guanine deaminase